MLAVLVVGLLPNPAAAITGREVPPPLVERSSVENLASPPSPGPVPRRGLAITGTVFTAGGALWLALGIVSLAAADEQTGALGAGMAWGLGTVLTTAGSLFLAGGSIMAGVGWERYLRLTREQAVKAQQVTAARRAMVIWHSKRSPPMKGMLGLRWGRSF